MRYKTKYHRIEVLTMNEAKEMVHTYFTTQMFSCLPLEVQKLLMKFYIKVKSIDNSIFKIDSIEIYTIKVKYPFFISLQYTYDMEKQTMELEIEYEGDNIFKV